MAGRKVFVGSLPDGAQESALRDEFAKYGVVEDVFVKPGCEPGRQWAMVTYANPAQAQQAKEATDRLLTLPGSDKPVEVMIARNQNRDSVSQTQMALPHDANSGGAKKIFVGSLPDSITENQIREEFSKYGQIMDLYLKTTCEPHKQWAFITFTSAQEAEVAKASADRQTKFPDAEFPCEVMLARNQGLNGRDPMRPPSQPQPAGVTQGPTKIFVGSLPDNITETVLRAEFSRFGQITDVYLKTGCEANKQWAFMVFATNDQAQNAKDATDRRLVIPGSSQPVEVMFAKFQGKNGQDPLTSVQGGQHQPAPAMPPAHRGGQGGDHHGGGAIPAPPPMSSMPPQYAWRVYQTPQGLAYYHNHATGLTQWECPPELHYSQVAMQQAQAAHAAQAQQASMYGAMYGMPAVAGRPAAQTPMYRPY